MKRRDFIKALPLLALSLSMKTKLIAQSALLLLLPSIAFILGWLIAEALKHLK